MFREDEEDFDIGETSLFALLYTQRLACPRQHLCFQYVRISILRSTLYHVEEEERKKEKENSLNCGRKKTQSIIYCSLLIVQRLIIST